MQKTRIICTIGPATESYQMLQKMYEAGMNIVRLNMSHGDHDSHAKVIQHIKTLNRKVKFPIPILLDTQGPAIRTGDLSNELDLREGVLRPSPRAGRWTLKRAPSTSTMRTCMRRSASEIRSPWTTD